MRSNPLDIVGQPKGLAVLGVAGAAAIALGAGGLVVNARATDQRMDNVRAEVVKSTDDAGYTELIRVEAIAADGTTFSASGTLVGKACS